MIAAVILAAGGSERLGRPKQVERYRGLGLLARSVEAALGAGCEPVVVVTGAYAERVLPELVGRDVHRVHNPDWEDGLGASIRCGIRALAPHGEVRAAILMACDQPNISAAVLTGLQRAFDGRSRARVASEYSGVLGVPALFERALFDDLARLGGDRGARSVLLAEPNRLARVPWPGGALDIDTDADLGG